MEERDVIRPYGQHTTIEVSGEEANATGQPGPQSGVSCDMERCQRAIECIDLMTQPTLDELALQRARATSDAQRAPKLASPKPRFKPFNRPLPLAFADQLIDVQSDGK